MWVVSQDGYRSLDILGIELVPANDVNEQNQIVRRCGGDTRNGGELYSENLY